MGWEVLFALALFCMVASVTPGPNNVMLLSSGATFGLRRTVPHVLGISTGCAAMVLVLGFGVGGIAQRLPGLHTVLHIVSTAYLLWLAWRIATSVPNLEGGATSGRPLRVIDAVAFQWVNPKAWAMVLGAVASFARPGHFGVDVPTIAAVLMLVGLPCILLWASAGSVLRRFLRQPRILRLFNLSMAALLAASIVPGLIELARR
jgi:threonine/homoserine/homoserine lactone efflux protein